ncbi:DNA phosphorothioation system sulfurtransferase DndC [bacterium]|nr:DNA phosphorothioation system sulfurtransferase DndC [bacterium]
MSKDELPIVQVESAAQRSFFDDHTIEDLYSKIQEIYLSDNRPWVIGYSGGKDSTATLQAIWHALSALDRDQLHKKVFVISSDTYVETPVVVDHITNNIEFVNQAAAEQGLPFEGHKVVPSVQDTFWVCLLGRGYPAPTTRFRWCTDRMKIRPADKFILGRVTEFGEVVMVLGARRGESASRDQVLKAREIEDSDLRRHSTLPNSYVYAPIEHFTTDDVWTYLLQVENPWGGDNQVLMGMYRSASADGECPLVVDKSTPSCGNSRFGCWVCPVVDRDHSMESMVDNGEEWMEPLLVFQRELATHKDPGIKRKLREIKGRNGKVRTVKAKKDQKKGARNWKKQEGDLMHGPYKFDVRKRLLRQLLDAQKAIRENGPDPTACLIREDELQVIRYMWRTELQDWEDSVPKIFNEIIGEDEIIWDDEDVTTLRINDAKLLQEICEDHDLPSRLVGKLIDLERDMQGMTKRAGIFNKIDKIFNEDWIEEKAVAEMFAEMESGESE